MLTMKKFLNNAAMFRWAWNSSASLSRHHNRTIMTVSSSSRSNFCCRSILMGHTASASKFRCLSTESFRGDVTANSSTLCSPVSSLPDPNTVNVVEYIESIQQTGNVAVLFSDAAPVLLTVDLLCALKDIPGR